MQKKISSKHTYDARIFTISKDMIEDHNGKQFERDIVHHHGGVGLLAQQDGKLLFVKQYRPAADQYLLEIPAGKLEQGENPYEAGLRELEEETGFTTLVLHKICQMYSTPGFCSEILYIYACDVLQRVEHPRPMDEDEEIELVWIGIDEALTMIEQDQIIDAKTIVAIQYAKLKEQS